MDTGDYYQPMIPTALSTPVDALDYNMNHPARGICLIIENANFLNQGVTRGLSKREGSHVDAEAVNDVFTKLSFNVLKCEDMTTIQVRNTLRHVSKLDHSDYDCFVCVVLTHGDHGNLYARDGRYAIDHLFNNFLGDKCPTLVGKPKLFFVQACQGSRLDPGVIVSTDALDSATYFKIPTYADFMIAYSTLPGFYSFRNTEKGSWFIRSLCQILGEYHLNLDLLSMMTLVCHRVAYYFSSNASNPAYSGMKQVPCITTMLTRRVFLHPKPKMNSILV